MTTTKKEFRQYTVAEENLILAGVDYHVVAKLISRTPTSIMNKRSQLARGKSVSVKQLFPKLDRSQQKEAVDTFMRDKNGSPVARPIGVWSKGKTLKHRMVKKASPEIERISPEPRPTARPKSHKFIVNGTNIEIEKDVKNVQIGVGFFKVDF